MLTLADRDLMQRDGALPGLATLLDPAEVLHRMASRWPDKRLHAAEPFYLRYKPGTGCLAGYRLIGPGKPIVLTIHAHRLDASDKLSNHLSKRVAGGSDEPRAIMPDALSITVFPDDRRLPRLRRLLGEDGTKRLAGKIGLATPLALEPLRYRPERRFVARLTAAGGVCAAVKLSRRDDHARVVANARAFVSAGSLVVPEVIGASDRFGVIISGWTDGDPLSAAPSAAFRAGAALAALHGQKPQHLRPILPAAQAKALLALADHLGSLWPPLAERAHRIARTLASALSDGDGDAVALHGDFHLDQLIDAGDAVGIVDFDEAGIGAAGWDVGNLIGHLAVADLATPRDRVEGVRDALVEGYRRAGGHLTDRDLAVHSAQSVFRLAGRPFRDRHPDWPERITEILALAERIAPSPTGQATRAASAIDLTAVIAEASDPARCAARFDLSPLGSGPWRVDSARLVRHKAGRRALIEYQVSGRRGDRQALLGKVRARGADLRTFALHHDLRRAGFGDDADDGIFVPQAVSVAPALSLWLQRKVAGQAFGLGDDRVMVDPARAARAIAKLHRCSVRPARRHTLFDELTILHTRLAALAQRRPAWRFRLERLRGAANAVATTALRVGPRLIHRDFYQDHLMCDGRAIHLLDLDLVCMGDPAVDIGNLGAHLIELGLRKTGDPNHFADWQHAFEHHYRRLTGDARDNIVLYEGLTLLRLVEIGDTMVDRMATNERLLALCEERFHAAVARCRIAGAH